MEDAEWMKSPMFKGVSAIEDFEFQPLSNEDRDENREIAYDIQHRKEQGTYNVNDETLHYKRLQKVAHVNKQTETEFFE